MKKVLLSTVLVCILSQMSFAQYGGFEGLSSAKLTAASDVKYSKDGDYVLLKGVILSKTGNDTYLFKDVSGTITVEINDEVWNGLNIKSTDNVILEGEVDKDFNSVKVEVNTIKLSE